MDFKIFSENALTMVVTLVKTLIKGKVDKEDGKGLSANDYTTTEKQKLAGIAVGANKTVVEDVLNSTSKSNALSAAQGKALKDQLDGVKESLGELGYGDMLASTYDTDGNGVVDDAEKLGGQLPGYYAKAADVPIKVSQITNDSGYQTSSQVEAAITAKGYQTETQVSAKIKAETASVYKPSGSVAFAALPAPAADKLGFVYNVIDAFITTDAFLEGAGRSYPAGSNVVVVADGAGYKLDALPGAVDLSNYTQKDDFVELTNAEVQQIWDSVVV